MSNPLNPLEWLRSTQDWFSRTERSSGFRPYLVFLILAYTAGIAMLAAFGEFSEVRALAIGSMGLATLSFIVLFTYKSVTDPDFCRSEQHIQKMTKMELESFGTETELVDVEVVEAQLLGGGQPDKALPSSTEASQ